MLVARLFSWAGRLWGRRCKVSGIKVEPAEFVRHAVQHNSPANCPLCRRLLPPTGAASRSSSSGRDTGTLGDGQSGRSTS